MDVIEKLEAMDAAGCIYWPPNGGLPRFKQYLDLLPGSPVTDLWPDIAPLNSQAAERLGYPTQKPLALLERIIQASSNPSDLVLDPFCGCGTTIAAAQRLGRAWVGIDVTHLAIALQKYRLKSMFDIAPPNDYKVIGEPQDEASAIQLAEENRYQFQWWGLSLIRGAKPVGSASKPTIGKKGKDKGIDGIANFIHDHSGKVGRVIIQVKSGKVGPKDIRDLRGTVEREEASIGIFITLEHPTPDMETEAISAGFYHSIVWGRDIPKIQMVTITDLLGGKEVEIPPSLEAFKQAKAEEKVGKTIKLDLRD